MSLGLNVVSLTALHQNTVVEKVVLQKICTFRVISIKM